jgi:Raf kinase inhibitor-like YbhB/YbcL family protein
VSKPDGEVHSMMRIESPAFSEGGEIPTDCTCEGADRSPPLEWAGAPGATKSFVLIVDDPDAPDPKAPTMVYVHWVLYNVPADMTWLGDGVRELPEGTREGLNDWNRTGYGGPCPPIGRHRYFHKLYALDTILPDLGTPTKDQVLQAMKGHVIAEAALMGTYEKRAAGRG